MIKAMARSHLPNNEWLKQTLVANMNLHSSCNAFWDGESVNFYRGSGEESVTFGTLDIDLNICEELNIIQF